MAVGKVRCAQQMLMPDGQQQEIPDGQIIFQSIIVKYT